MQSSARLSLLIAVNALALGCAGGSGATKPAESAPAQAGPTTATPAQASGSASGQAFESATDDVFFASIPASVSDSARALVRESSNDAEFVRALRVRIRVMGGRRDLGELTRRTKSRLVNGTFQLSDLSQFGTHDKPTAHDQSSSFVIDYEEAAFETPIAEFEKSGKPKSSQAIAAFASQYISEETYTRDFDIASRVAQSRAGDCTEHAVFATALLRRFGFTARVVMGVVLVGLTAKEIEPQLLAFGHAWVELYEEGRWRIVDTALSEPEGGTNAERAAMSDLPPDAKIRLAYLPLNVLRNESVSFTRSLTETGIETIVRVEVDVSGKAK